MTTPKPTDPKAAEAALRQLEKAGVALAWTAGYIAMPWSKLRDIARADANIPSYAISADGVLSVNPAWLASQQPTERVFELAASMLRFLLRHHDRGVSLGVVHPQTGGPVAGQEHEHQLWGKACAMVTNAPLKAESIGTAPADALFPPEGYTGAPDAESLYYHLLKTEPPPPPGGGQGPQNGQQQGPPPPPHAGGHPQPPQGSGGESDEEEDDAGGNADGESNSPNASGGTIPPEKIDEMRRAVEALARMAGKGSAIVDALTPKVARTNYRNVIDSGLDFASTESDERNEPTYSRASRREALFPGLMLPGYNGSEPSLCVVIDKSGSTKRFAQKFIDHAFKVAKDFPETKIYLAVHTDRVVWEGWIKPGGDVKTLEEATKFDGGTLFQPAYEAARVAGKKLPGGKFDALVHFTDGANGAEWPQPPSRRFVVGLCGDVDETPTPLPGPAKVIPISMGE